MIADVQPEGGGGPDHGAEVAGIGDLPGDQEASGRVKPALGDLHHCHRALRGLRSMTGDAGPPRRRPPTRPRPTAPSDAESESSAERKDLDQRCPGLDRLLDEVRAFEQGLAAAPSLLDAMKPGCLGNPAVAVGQARLHVDLRDVGLPGLGHLDQLGERLRVAHCHLGQHLAVDLDLGGL